MKVERVETYARTKAAGVLQSTQTAISGAKVLAEKLNTILVLDRAIVIRTKEKSL
jgi:hypothetical protein